MKIYQKPEIAYERVLFFSDAIVAIAITLLALELKVETPAGRPLSFADLLKPWHTYVAFMLSFFNISAFWRTHHDFFIPIRKMNEQLFYVNILWLFFIIVLPFSTRVLSDHFGNTPAIFLYSLNIFLLAICQNFIWDYADMQGFVDKAYIEDGQHSRLRLMLNLDMLNGLVAVLLSLLYPTAAFFLLFFKIPAFLFMVFYMKRNKAQALKTRTTKIE